MKFKLIASVVAVGGVLMFSGIEPSDALDEGGEAWNEFSGDFLAIFNGEAQDKLAQEMRDNASGEMKTICNDAPVVADDDETAALARDINRERCETLKNSRATTVLSADELKQRLKDQNLSVEELQQRLDEQRKLVE